MLVALDENDVDSQLIIGDGAQSLRLNNLHLDIQFALDKVVHDRLQHQDNLDSHTGINQVRAQIV